MPSRENHDGLLMDRITARDRDAFAELYDRHASVVYALLRRLLGSDPVADDVLQETFWHAWSRPETFDVRRGSARSWLLCVARSRAIDAHRRARAAMRLHESEWGETSGPFAGEPRAGDGGGEPIDGRGGAIDDGSDSIPAALERRESARVTRGALARLPQEQSEVIRLAFYDGLSHRAIAQRTALPLGTVKTRIRLGMERLRSLLHSERGASSR